MEGARGPGAYRRGPAGGEGEDGLTERDRATTERASAQLERAQTSAEPHRVLATVVSTGSDGAPRAARLVGERRVDLSTVDTVARIALAARRAGRRIRLEGVVPSLADLLELTGVAAFVGLGTDRIGDGTIDDLGPVVQSYPYERGEPCPRPEGETMPTTTTTTTDVARRTDDPTIRVRGLHTVGVPVTDQDRALRFYVGTLGFDARLDVPIGNDKRWIVVAPAEGTTTIALVAASDRVPAGVETGIRLISADVPGDHAALVARGVDVDEILRWPGVPAMFSFRDQDGNGLELVADG